MNRIKASLGITALVVATLGFTGPTQAAESAPTAISSVVSFEAPVADLNFEEVSVITIPAPEPITVEEPAPIVEAEPAPVVEAPVPISEPSSPVVPEPSPVEAPAPEVVPDVPVETPAPVVEPDYWDNSGGRMMNFQGDGSEAYSLFLSLNPSGNFGSYRGVFAVGFPPIGNYTVIPSAVNPAVIYVFVTDEMDDEVLGY